MVHLGAPTTYAIQYKQLCDSKIYDFKHEGYHTVNCISKELGYRNNRGTRRHEMIPVVPSLCKEVRLRWRGVVVTKTKPTPQRLTLFSCDPRHKGLGHFFH